MLQGEHSAILLTFLSYHLKLRVLFCLFLSGCLRQYLLYACFQVRQNVSDFGVLIAIIIMVILDSQLGLPTPKLEVPTEFKVSMVMVHINPWFEYHFIQKTLQNLSVKLFFCQPMTYSL